MCEVVALIWYFQSLESGLIINNVSMIFCSACHGDAGIFSSG